MSVDCPTFLARNYPDLCLTVDHYCERTDFSFDAEPVNALSNLAFLVASWMAWRLHWKNDAFRGNILIRALIIMIGIIGIGSFIFHIFATRWAEWSDVFPILTFMIIYLWLISTLLFAWPNGLKVIAISVFLVATIYLETGVSSSFLWGGAMYLPAVIILSVICVVVTKYNPYSGRAIAVAASVFLLSLTIRSMDLWLCDVLPIGTHFIWHILNAVLLYLLIRMAILYAPLIHPD